MGTQNQSNLQIVFLPFPTPGHMIPMVDLAKIFATFNGVNSTIITTPANAAVIQVAAGEAVDIRVLDFPAPAVGLPAGVENYGAATSIDMRSKLSTAIAMLQNPTQDLIRQISPDCIISDMFYPWTSDFAAQIGVPRFVFQSSSIFSLCCSQSIRAHAPHRRVDSDAGLVSLPDLPHDISMIKSQLPEWERHPNAYTCMIDVIEKAARKSQGYVANTLQEMEVDYVEHFESVTGLKVWPMGPVSLWAGYDDGSRIKAQRGRNNGLDSWASCLEWLDQRKPSSVLYVSFGSLTRFPAQQLKEIAAGLESSGHNFLWVVRGNNKNNNNNNNNIGTRDDDRLPAGFRDRMRETNQGYIIEDWAPQLLILEHKSVGGMVTHCGWNSILEGVNAGLPLVTWPLFAEQFYNERLVVDVLKIGVAVGTTTWCDIDNVGEKEVVGRDKVAVAAMAVLGEDDQATNMRRRVADLSAAAKRAVKTKDGSSQANLMAFIEGLRANRLSQVA